MTASQIETALTTAPPRRTLQYRLKSLVDSKRLTAAGTGRWARYRLPRPNSLAFRARAGLPTVSFRLEVLPPLSPPGTEIREYVRRPPATRRPVGYDREFLESYRPNETFYLSRAERERLHEAGRPVVARQPAGTHARQILNRLLILSFEDVPRDLYTEAILGVYELQRVELLRDVFIWAYERSAARYAAVQQSLGEPDPFRLQYRSELREVVAAVIRKRMNRKQATAHVADWTGAHIEKQHRERFREVAERELLSLHEGNFARYRVRPSEFEAWQEVWTGS